MADSVQESGLATSAGNFSFQPQPILCFPSPYDLIYPHSVTCHVLSLEQKPLLQLWPLETSFLPYFANSSNYTYIQKHISSFSPS